MATWPGAKKKKKVSRQLIEGAIEQELKRVTLLAWNSLGQAPGLSPSRELENYSVGAVRGHCP